VPVFVYEAKNVQGVLLKGKMEASDERTVTLMLREKSYYPVKVKLYKESLNVDLASLKKISLKDISIFCRQFSVIISAGISIIKAVEIVKEQTENPKLKKILLVVNQEIQKGKTFSVALREHKDIPDMLVNLVEVGETSGTLDKMLETLSKYYEKEYKQQQKVRQATTYPKVIIVFALSIVSGLVTFVVPTFAQTIISSGGTIPLPTKIVMGMADFIKSYGLVILVMAAFIFLVIKISGSKNRGTLKNDKYVMKLPVYGKIYSQIITARFARTFGILMSSGVPIIQSLEISTQVLNSKTIGDTLISLKEEVKKGSGIGGTLDDRKVFPPMLTQMIKIGEESGNLDEVLGKTADFYDDEVEVATAKMTSLIEPAIIIVLAVVVGFIVLSIALPMFSMYDAAGK
jgi:type IV pilus assembly protein PilC